MEADYYLEAYREATPRAAKPYQCCECRGQILVGNRYHYATGAGEGEWHVYRTCAACAEIRRVFSGGSWAFEELWEWIRLELFGGWRTVDVVEVTEAFARLKSYEAIQKLHEEYVRYLEDQQ